MDCELFARMVKGLLQERGHVSLPGFGSFLTEDVPASFSDRGFTINPPYRKVIFRTGGEDDGALLDVYMKSNQGVSDRLAADDYLKSFIFSLKQELCRTKSVTLPGLGKLRATRENNFFFVPDENPGIFPQFDLLPPVSLHSTAVSEPEIPRIAPGVPPFVPPSVPPTRFERRPASPTVTPEPDRKAMWTKVALIGVCCIAAAYLALVILGRVAPSVIDPLLYSEEELEIIRND